MKIYVFSGTHWDREWYQTFQGFRMRLVKMTTDLIDGLETNEKYGVFHFDGQTIVLEDYLQIVPENKERLTKLIKSGKILVGPWYCMPDEFLLSGESLIKNLQLGHKIARDFGVEPLKYGYICDIFGHIAQMPQIFKQFGIDHCCLGRGTNEHTTDMYFDWESPDESRVRAFKLEDAWGYTDMSRVLKTSVSEKALRDNLKELIDREIKRSGDTGVVILMDAVDHNVYHPDTPHYIEIIKELYPDAEVLHTSVLDACRELDKCQDLQVKQGELNETGKEVHAYIHLITNTLSSRYPLKQQNDKLQTMLEKYAAPLYAFGQVSLPIGFLDTANKYLLQNHPHDSICGCSIDRVHRDMLYRFDQGISICKEINDAFKRTYTQEDENGDLRLQLYNPLPYSDTRTVEAWVAFPQDFPTILADFSSSERINSFRLYDKNGSEIPYGILDVQNNYKERLYDQVLRVVNRYKIAFEAELSPMGITTYTVQPDARPSRYLNAMQADERGMENAYLKVTIRDNGSLDIFDKTTGTTYEKLLTAIEDGELGDGWCHADPTVNSVVTNTSADIACIHHSAAQTTFRIAQTLMVPKRMTQNKFGHRRSTNYTAFCIVHEVSLGANDRFIRVKTTVDNNIPDHRLRIKLPSGITSDTYLADQPFCFVKRHTGIDTATQDWSEPEQYEKQMTSIVTVQNDKQGLAFVSEGGLHECSVRENGDMYVTLFRGFRKTVMTNGEPDGQLLQKLTFSYLLYPYDPTAVSLADLKRRQEQFAADLLVSTARQAQAEPCDPVLSLDSKHILYSTAVPAENGMELRLYNMSDEEDSVVLSFQKPLASAAVVDLDGKELTLLSPNDKTLTLTLPKWKIATVRCQF